MSNRTKIIVLASALIMAGLVLLGYLFRVPIAERYRDWQTEPVPPAVTRTEFESQLAVDTTETTAEPEETSPEEDSTVPPQETTIPEPEPTTQTEDSPTVPDETEQPWVPINLQVPFMVQAPSANWDELHGESCEEASAIMLAAYYSDETDITADEAESRIMDAVEWEQANLGYHLDTTAEETARMMREHFELNGATVEPLESLDDIRTAVSTGHPVIVPAYGKVLGNPYFRNGGPLYHMLVIKGFDGNRIITNDPGTRRGADFIYDSDVLWNAIHDWNNGDVPYGPKVMIVVR